MNKSIAIFAFVVAFVHHRQWWPLARKPVRARR